MLPTTSSTKATSGRLRRTLCRRVEHPQIEKIDPEWLTDEPIRHERVVAHATC